MIKYLSKVTAEMPSWKTFILSRSSSSESCLPYTEYASRQTDSAVSSLCPAMGDITHPSDRCGRLGVQDAATHFLCR